MGRSSGQFSVLTIGERTYVPDWTEIEFVDPMSTHDFDVVIWDPNNFARPSPNDFGQVDAGQVLSAIDRRRNEFATFLRLGGVIIVFAGPENRMPLSTMGYFEESDMRGGWDAFPADKPELSAASGAMTRVVGSSQVSAFLRQNQKRVEYSATIKMEAEGNIVALAGKKTSEVVGSVIDYSTGGRLVLLPEMNREFWTNRGADDEDFDELDTDATRAFYVSLVEACLPAIEDDVPAWIAGVSTQAEVNLTARVEALKSELQVVQKKLDSLEFERGPLDADKLLLYGTGDLLAERCASVLERFGAIRLESERDRADLRFEYEELILVVEVKGLGKSAKEENSAQLEKWVMEEVQAGTEFAKIKPLLLVNTYRLKPLEKRTESFPSQMIPMSTNRNHALVTTVQLFVMAADVAEGRMGAKDAMSTLISTVGKLDGFTAASLARNRG